MYAYTRESMVAQGDYGAYGWTRPPLDTLHVRVKNVFAEEGITHPDWHNMPKWMQKKINRRNRDIEQQYRQLKKHLNRGWDRKAKNDRAKIEKNIDTVRKLAKQYKQGAVSSAMSTAAPPVTGMQRATHTPLLGPQAMAASILQSLGIQPAPSTAAEQAAAAAVDAVAASSAAASTAPAEDVAYWYESGYTQGNGAAANGEGFVSTPLPPRPFWTKPLFYVPATALGLYGAYQYYQARQEA